MIEWIDARIMAETFRLGMIKIGFWMCGTGYMMMLFGIFIKHIREL